MKNKILSLLIGLLLPVIGFGQHSWVYFTGDGNPVESVNQNYIKVLKSFDVDIVGTSKWFNAACVKGVPSYLESLNIVDRVEPLKRYKTTTAQTTTTYYSYGNSDWQLQMLRLDSFHRRGYTGKDVTVGLFDAGFYKADTVDAFDSLWQNGRIKAYWDFITNDTSIFWEYDGHGKYVLSIIAANWPDSMMGAAPEANYILARTENVNSETHLEEYAWVKAMEWADSIGVDIIHSSLGYSVFDTLEGDYTYEDMDGETTIITKATTIAFNKGIFVTNSAGNEGNDDWKHITAPCDGKHVLCVGAVDSNRQHAAFSSYGPSYDGRVKPEVMAMGQGVTYINNQANLRTGNGTSFSGPLIAGMVACLKQAWPDLTNQQIFDAVIQSADRYDNPDTAYGYGIPDVIKADSLLSVFSTVKSFASPFIFKIYPNPIKSVTVVNSDELIQSITIRSLVGHELLQIKVNLKNTVELELMDLLPGFYVVDVETANSRGLQKIQKL